MLVRNVIEAYTRFQHTHMARSTALSRNSLVTRWLLPALGEREITSVTPADIDAIYDTMEREGLAKNTLFGAYAAFLSFFKYAQDHGFIEDDPAKRARKYARAAKEEQ